MALNPIVFTEKIVCNCLRYQLKAYSWPFKIWIGPSLLPI